MRLINNFAPSQAYQLQPASKTRAARTFTLRQALRAQSITFSLALFAALAAPPTFAQSPNNTPMITIEAPQFNAVMPRGTVAATVRLRAGVDQNSFGARLNGTDIHESFHPQSGCGGDACELTADLPQELLVRGNNVLTFHAEGEGKSADAARTQFLYADDAASLGDSVEHLVASVPINTDYYDGGNPASVSAYHILMGPAPGFPRRDYSANHLSCPSGLDSLHVVVLERDSLEPDSAVAPGTDHPGQVCVGDAAALNTLLASVTAGRMVIVSGFVGYVSGLDTTTIGGTIKPGLHAHAYSIVGVKGAPEGSAHESYNRTISYYSQIAPLIGSLMLDNQQKYSFASSEFRELEVLPGAASSRIILAGQAYSGSSGSGGFFLCEFNRRANSPGATWTFHTNQSNQSEAIAELNQLTAVLERPHRERLLVLTTIGTPFTTATANALPAGLSNVITRLGGTAAALPRLAVPQADGTPQRYSLISSSDPDYLANPSQIVEASSLWSAQKETGIVQALVVRDATNRWVASSPANEQLVDDEPQKAVDFQWTTVGFQQAQAWPEWTGAQQLAYADLTATNSRYPLVKESLSCAALNCPEIRSYYSGVIGGGGSAALRIPYDSLVYVPNNDYEETDFDVVINQLKSEKADLANVESIYEQFAKTTNNSADSIQKELETVATNMEGGLFERNQEAAVTAQNLEYAAKAAPLLAVIPGASGPSSALAALLRCIATFSFGSQDLPAAYLIKLGELRAGTSRLGVNLADSNDTFFVSVVTDWGKLRTMGGGYGSQEAPWYMCATCKGSNLPSAAIPVVAAEAKKGFYQQLLPLAFSIDRAYNLSQTSPRNIGGLQQIPGPAPTYFCRAPYENAPEGAWISYPSSGNTSLNDFVFFDYTEYGSSGFPYNWTQINFPSEALVTDLFDPPGLSYEGKLNGGAGFTLERFTSGTLLANRALYLPGTACVAP